MTVATELRAGPFELSPDEHALRVDGEIVALTRREFQVLHLLFLYTGKPVPRERIQREIWGEPAPGHQDRSVDVHIRKLRAKLAAAAPQWSCIHTHFAVGYRLDPQRLAPGARRGRYG